jgi:hypothetical protein
LDGLFAFVDLSRNFVGPTGPANDSEEIGSEASQRSVGYSFRKFGAAQLLGALSFFLRLVTYEFHTAPRRHDDIEAHPPDLPRPPEGAIRKAGAFLTTS